MSELEMIAHSANMALLLGGHIKAFGGLVHDALPYIGVGLASFGVGGLLFSNRGSPSAPANPKYFPSGRIGQFTNPVGPDGEPQTLFTVRRNGQDVTLHLLVNPKNDLPYLSAHERRVTVSQRHTPTAPDSRPSDYY